VFGPVDQPFPTAMTSATFSRDGRRVLTSSNDGVLRIWSTEAAAPLNEVESAARQRLTRGYTAAERSEYLNEND
jgi:WD40 repeat protein